jgi:hypothetical protein
MGHNATNKFFTSSRRAFEPFIALVFIPGKALLEKQRPAFGFGKPSSKQGQGLRKAAERFFIPLRLFVLSDEVPDLSFFDPPPLH